MRNVFSVLLLDFYLLYGFGILKDVSPEPTDSVPVDPPKVPELPCLITALTDSADLVVKLGLLMCTYDKFPQPVTEENAKAFFNALQETMKSVPCVADELLNKATDLKSIGKHLSEFVIPLADKIRKTLDHFGITGKVMEALCELFKDALDPECLPKLLTVDLLNFLIDLANACKGQNAERVYQDIATILGRLPCVLGIKETTLTKRSLPDFPVLVDPKIVTKDLLLKVICIPGELILKQLLPGVPMK